MGVRHSRTVFLLIAVSVLVRLLVAARAPLIDDEAYYWLWSRRLDWGYLDHPPLIAYLIALTTIPGDGPTWIRLGAILAGAGTTALLFLLGRELFGSRAGLLAAALFQVIPVLAGGGLLATPDAPLYLAWMAALWAGWQAIRGSSRLGAWHPGARHLSTRYLGTRSPGTRSPGTRSLGSWIVVGVAIGLGMLSKLYTVFLIVGFVLFLVLRARAHLLRRNVYIGGLIAIVIFTPVIYWNATHDWAGLRFILFERPGGTPTGISGIVELLVQQLAFALVLFFALIWAVVVAWRRRGEEPYAFLFWTSLPALVFPFLAAASTGAPHGNWLGPAYLGLIVILGATWNRVIASLAAVNTALVAYALLVPLVTSLPLLPGAEDYIGWENAATRIQVELSTVGSSAIVVADRYQIASQLGYYLRDTIPVTMLPCPPAASIWSPPGRFAGANAVTAIDARWIPSVQWEQFFARVEEAAPVTVTDRGKPVRRFRVFRLYDLRPHRCAP